MRYGAVPTSLVERVALAAGRVPVPVLDAVLGPLKARAIMAGVSLGVFEALADGAQTACALSVRLGLDVNALELLLRMLVVSDYLEQRADRFELAPLARRTMVVGGSTPLAGYLRFNYEQWEMMGHLEELVRTGRGRDFHDGMVDPERWRDYQQGMLEIARMEARMLAGRIPVPLGAVSLLDIGGSHGLFGAAVCRRHPPLHGTVLDLPQAIRHARVLAADEGIGDVVSHVEGDVLTSDLGRRDVILLFNILHHFPDDRAQSILRRVHDALRQEGVVAIWEFEAARTHSRATSGDAAALFFRLTSTARAYHAEDYAHWLREAGFRDVRLSRPMASPGKVLVTARR